MNVLRSARGIAIIYVTLFLMVLGLLFFALGIDAGWLAYVRTQGQTATDGSALRGAAAIPNYNDTNDPSVVYDMAKGLNSENTVMNQDAGVQDGDVEFCDGTPESPSCSSGKTPADGVKVTRSYSAPLYFSKLFLQGNKNSDINVSSIAWLGGLSEGKADLPVTLCGQAIGFDFTDPTNVGACNPDQTATFNPNGTDTAGYWSVISTSMSASTCKDLVENPENIPTVKSGDLINLNNGVINSCLKDIGDRFAGCDEASCDGTKGEAEKERCSATLPIIDCPSSINQQEKVKGFGTICITKVESQQNKFIFSTLECKVTHEGRGGGIFLGTYATRPVLVK